MLKGQLQLDPGTVIRPLKIDELPQKELHLHSGEHQQELQEFQRVFCPEHKEEPIRYFCLKCQIPICRDCKVLTHDEHKCTSLDTAIETVKPKLASMLEKLVDKISGQENDLTTLQGVLRDFGTNTSSVMKDISDHSRHLQQQIQQQEIKLLQEVQQVSEAHKKNITLYMESSEVTTSTMKSTSDLVSSILSRGTTTEILILQQQVEDRLQELLLPYGGGDIPQHLSLQLQTNNDVDRESDDLFKTSAGIQYLVVDYENNIVCRFSSDGQLLVQQSKAGSRSNRPCAKFTSSDGEFLQFLATKEDRLQHPLGLTINHDDDLAVSQSGGKVTVFRYMVSD
ncbi:tripartite motif-containing protein 45-like [Lingula anatina]|uniref:Tripartite motif-containing protein 45-like n=1 Tax=Lingula anatina TaxID=7574 RepID=A0A1S3KGD1_LINAN|nr:tripartite motif-containing protein 45-like [Lingula anatina]|eukprot:XP_013421547.1 tripartite motif-containing protein 45-like [Lingula anatina]